MIPSNYILKYVTRYGLGNTDTKQIKVKGTPYLNKLENLIKNSVVSSVQFYIKLVQCLFHAYTLYNLLIDQWMSSIKTNYNI